MRFCCYVCIDHTAGRVSRKTSPQSNGMSEAFVKTLKRDYIRISALPDAQTALRLIEGWIEDYNEIHPHSALKMASCSFS